MTSDTDSAARSAAAVAAVALTVPDTSRLWRFLPALSGAAWLGTLGVGCLRDWAETI